MHLFLTIYMFLIGTIFGSFFNVVGLRVPKRSLFASQRSYCPNCHHTLAWFELIPVLSYLLQGGKCRNCKQTISPMYPIIELATGILFAYSYIHFGLQLELIISLLLMSVLAIIVVTDLTYMLIPDRILLFFLPLFIVGRLMVPLDPWWSSVTGALFGLGIVAVVIFASNGGMGGGDMKLLGLIGLVLGYKLTIVAFFLSTLYGSVICGILLALKVIDRKNPVPFGPFIVLGTITSYFFGQALIDWYLAILF
ncbi:prepilin peptidase [Aquibacillus sediminis]|uniref:prepilin peptidase n=1 Tax=Aquibacillus sediminis TaxID=2574734 RepID=UPI0011095AA6|nr:A24 family peptidase [Aquibacillus sediminis]